MVSKLYLIKNVVLNEDENRKIVKFCKTLIPLYAVTFENDLIKITPCNH